MATYNLTANATVYTVQVATDKVRVASTASVYFTSGPYANTAADNNSPVILGNVVERSIYVGANNYVSIKAVSAEGLCSVTELGTTGVL